MGGGFFKEFRHSPWERAPYCLSVENERAPYCLSVENVLQHSNICVIQVCLATSTVNEQEKLDGVYFKYSDGTVKYFGGTRNDHSTTSVLLNLDGSEFVRKIFFRLKKNIVCAIQFTTNTNRSSFCSKFDSLVTSEDKEAENQTHIALSTEGGIAGFQCESSGIGSPFLPKISKIYEFIRKGQALSDNEWNLIGDDPLVPSRKYEVNCVQLPVTFLSCFSTVSSIYVKHEADFKLAEIIFKHADQSTKTFGSHNQSIHISPPPFIISNGEFIETVRYQLLNGTELCAIQFITNNQKLSPFYGYKPCFDVIYAQKIRGSKGFAGLKCALNSLTIDGFLEFGDGNQKEFDDVMPFDNETVSLSGHI